ncbi:MAG: hypothetical protein ACKVX7_12045 [Planctomycetota bacterium]
MRLAWLAFILCCFSFGFVAVADDGSNSFTKRPLDLPSGGINEDDDEEDLPESIVFYGAEIEGDAFLWCFPVFGFCGETTVFNAIKSEIANGLQQVSNRTEFDLIGYNSQTYIWRLDPPKGNAANKASALAWMNLLVPIEAHNLLEAALTTLNISHTASGRDKHVIIMGVHAPWEGDSALEAITAANYEHAKIDTFYFTTTYYSGEADFYIDLAAMNGGTFHQVDY